MVIMHMGGYANYQNTRNLSMTEVGLTEDVILAENEVVFRAYTLQHIQAWLNLKPGGFGPKNFIQPRNFLGLFPTSMNPHSGMNPRGHTGM